MARRSQEDRNRAAQAKLSAMGRDPGPLRGAEYRHRVAKAEQRGLSAGQAVGKPRKGEPTKTELRREGKLPPLRAREPRHVNLGPRGDLHTSTDRRYVLGVLRAGANEGMSAEARITATGIKHVIRNGELVEVGTVTETRTVDGTQAAVTAHIFGVIDAGYPPGSLTSGSDTRLEKKPGFVIGPTGIPAAVWVAYLTAYQTIEDALIDLWDQFYTDPSA